MHEPLPVSNPRYTEVCELGDKHAKLKSPTAFAATMLPDWSPDRSRSKHRFAPGLRSSAHIFAGIWAHPAHSSDSTSFWRFHGYYNRNRSVT